MHTLANHRSSVVSAPNELSSADSHSLALHRHRGAVAHLVPPAEQHVDEPGGDVPELRANLDRLRLPGHARVDVAREEGGSGDAAQVGVVLGCRRASRTRLENAVRHQEAAAAVETRQSEPCAPPVAPGKTEQTIT